MKERGLEIDELRAHAARTVRVELPDLVKLRRVTWWSLIQVALLVLAASAVIGYFAGIDFDQLWDELQDAIWGWVLLGLFLAQLPRLTQAVATLGSVPVHLPYGPVYAMQLATGYMNLALPSYAARLAMNIRFFQRQGVSSTVAVTSGAIDSFTSTALQIVLIGILLLFTQATVSMDLDAPDGDSLSLLWIILGLLVATVIVAALVGRLRRAIVSRVRAWWPEIRGAVGALRGSNKLLLLLGGSFATELLFATTLGVFALAFGSHVSIVELLVINMSVSLLASFIPVPGGIGVVEFGLTAGLTAAGMSPESALAATICYRLATFYVPPVWGVFPMRWLQRNRYV
jgi:uncharacterized membrane protein YbhN (UPF0104 family)